MNDTPQRLTVRFRIFWESGWHAGSGEDSAGVDRLVRRRGLAGGPRLPLLPGSQLKGVLRHQCERLAALLGCPVVSPHQLARTVNQELLDHFQPLRGSGLVIDRLFGSRYQGDCLFVDDAVPETNDPWPGRAHARTSIDRLTRTARDQTLFVSEVVSGGPDRPLFGVLRARHAPGVLTALDDQFPLEYALLLAGLITIDSLGGNRSAGLGRCRIELCDKQVAWNDCPKHPLAEALKGMEEEDWQVMLDLVREEMGA